MNHSPPPPQSPHKHNTTNLSFTHHHRWRPPTFHHARATLRRPLVPQAIVVLLEKRTDAAEGRAPGKRLGVPLDDAGRLDVAARWTCQCVSCSGPHEGRRSPATRGRGTRRVETSRPSTQREVRTERENERASIRDILAAACGARHATSRRVHIVIRGHPEVRHHAREIGREILDARHVVKAHPTAIAVSRAQQVGGREPVQRGGVPVGESRDVAHTLLYRLQHVCAEGSHPAARNSWSARIALLKVKQLGAEQLISSAQAAHGLRGARDGQKPDGSARAHTHRMGVESTGRQTRRMRIFELTFARFTVATQWKAQLAMGAPAAHEPRQRIAHRSERQRQIGRASCRERV